MFQILLILGVITLIYLIAREPKSNFVKKSTEMVKCQNCDINLPLSEAIQNGDNWLCSNKCQT